MAVEKADWEQHQREYENEVKIKESEIEAAKAKRDAAKAKLKAMGSERIGMCVPRGPYIGLDLFETWGRLRTAERSRETEQPTEEFVDSKDPLGGGVIVGYNFAPFRNNIVVSPFFSFDWVDQTVTHRLPGAASLSTSTQWVAEKQPPVDSPTLRGEEIFESREGSNRLLLTALICPCRLLA